jgi:hypothetical protein
MEGMVEVHIALDLAGYGGYKVSRAWRRLAWSCRTEPGDWTGILVRTERKGAQVTADEARG